MKVVLLSCVFLPEPVTSANTSFQLAKTLLKAGYKVEVITNFPNKPAGVLFDGYKRSLARKTSSEWGFPLIRCFSTLSPESGMLGRFMENVSFGITSGLALLFTEKPAVIYANTWPIFAQGISRLVAWVRRIPIVFSVQDIYPDSLYSQGRVKESGWVAKLLRWLDMKIMRSSQGVILISEKHKEIFLHDRGLSERKIHVIPNWIDENSINKKEDGTQFRESIGIDKTDFLFVYAGNIGTSAGVEQLVDAFKYLGKKENIKLLVAGDGANLVSCQKLVEEHRLDKVIIHSPWQQSENNAVLSAADVFLLPTRGEQSLYSVPSKLMSYMMASRPILALAQPQSETTEIIQQSNCGWVIEPDNRNKLSEKIIEISGIDADSLNSLGVNGRNYAFDHFTMDRNLPRILEVLDDAAQGTDW